MIGADGPQAQGFGIAREIVQQVGDDAVFQGEQQQQRAEQGDQERQLAEAHQPVMQEVGQSEAIDLRPLHRLGAPLAKVDKVAISLAPNLAPNSP